MTQDALSELHDVIREPFAQARKDAFLRWRQRWLVRLSAIHGVGDLPFDGDEAIIRELMAGLLSSIPNVVNFYEEPFSAGTPEAKTFKKKITAYFYAFRNKPAHN